MLIDMIKKTLPEYKITLPISKQKITFRPLLVKEEKFISMLNDLSSSTEDKLTNLSNLVNSCCNDKINSLDLFMYDFQYLLTEIRKKSVDETSKLTITCPNTGEKIITEIDLNQYNTKKETSSVLELDISKEMIIKIRSPKLKDLKEINNFPESKKELIELILNCFDSVETPEENMTMKDSTKEEKLEFLNYITKKDFEKIQNFIMSTFISFQINYTTSDGVSRKIEVNDFVNFLKFYLIMLV